MKKSKNKEFWLIVLGIIAFMVVCYLASSYADLSRIPHRDEGIWAVETLTSEGEVTGVGGGYVFANGRRRRRQHNISIYVNELGDYTGLSLTPEELAKYSVGDTVTVTREVYYLKPGFRVYYKDSIS